MRKLYFLLLMVATLVYATGCTVAKNECTTDGDCNEGDKCYAAYCSASVPSGGFYLQANLVDVADQAELACQNTLVDKIKVNLLRGDFRLPAEDTKHTFNDDTPYKYEFILDCKELNKTDLVDTAYYIGADKNKNGMGPLQQNKEYTLILDLLNSAGNSIGTQEYAVTPSIAPSAVAPDVVVIETEKTLTATLKTSWHLTDNDLNDLSEGNSDFCYNTGDDQTKVELFYTKLSKDGMTACDNEGNCDFTGYDTIACKAGVVWVKDFVINEALNYTLEIYAVGRDDLVKYQKVTTVPITESKLAEEEITLPAKELDPVTK